MKKTTYIITSTFAAFLLASCATTQEITAEPATVEVAEAAEPKQLIVQESPEDIFIKSLEGITIKSVSSPKEVYKGRNALNYNGFSLFSYNYIFNDEYKNDHTEIEFKNLLKVLN